MTEPGNLVAANSFAPVSSVLDGLLKEIARRVELRQRLEAEQGGPISDEAFLEIAERTGGMRL
ncbi:MAG: hypothetical protein OJF50_006750 [Nitrospira sp.]|jgi:EAL domain-containing protein (putative c-di-GMP-specific phosphodiesterase class I)|nr:hypothetical protein [Nitrospira sp.]